MWPQHICLKQQQQQYIEGLVPNLVLVYSIMYCPVRFHCIAPTSTNKYSSITQELTRVLISPSKQNMFLSTLSSVLSVSADKQLFF